MEDMSVARIRDIRGSRRGLAGGYRPAFAALAAVLLLLPLAPSAHAGTTTFTITGRGYGHGVGMSQYGAEGYARQGRDFRWILAHYYSGTTITPVSNLEVRVMLLEGASRVTFASSARMSVYDEATKKSSALSASTKYAVTVSSGRYAVFNASTGSPVGVFAGPIRIRPGTSVIRVYNANANGQSGLRYRGWLRLLIRSGRLRVVNHVPVESYLRGVVAGEMPPSWRPEALKAQAVAARSYALSRRSGSGDFDLYATTASQYYGAVEAEDSRTNSAIAASQGLALYHSSAVIPAYFHSTSGGMTENVENVWGGSALGWARSVTDEYDTISPYHSWPNNPIRYTPQALAAKLGVYSSSNPSGVKGSLRGVVVVETGASPRVKKLEILGSGGTTYISGAGLRSKLGLRSTWFFPRAMSITSTTTIVPYGRPLAITGKVVPPPSNFTLVFRARRIGATRWGTAELKTNSSGSFYKTVIPYAGTYYQTALGWATSPPLLVRIRAGVSLAAGSSDIRLGQATRLGGGVAPNHAGKSVEVKLYSASRWVRFTSRVLDSSSRYAVSFKPSRRGTFYFVTVFPSDSDHVGNVSRVQTVIVR